MMAESCCAWLGPFTYTPIDLGGALGPLSHLSSLCLLPACILGLISNLTWEDKALPAHS